MLGWWCLADTGLIESSPTDSGGRGRACAVDAESADSVATYKLPTRAIKCLSSLQVREFPVSGDGVGDSESSVTTALAVLA